MWLAAGMTPPAPRGTTVDLTVESAAAGGSAGLTAYTVRPADAQPGVPLPGVVLVHEAFGLDDEMRAHADRVAAMGYAVAAPDLFADGGARRCLKGTFQALRSGRGRAFQDIGTARQWLLDQEDAAGAVGVIGFCMGGGFALLCAAPERGFDVSAVNYGQLPPTPDVLTGACPIVASYGGRDFSLRGAAAKLETQLSRLGVEHDVVEYPDASHAFLNEHVNGPWFLRPVLAVTGFGPEPASAADAWARIEQFFAAHLRG